MTKKTLYIILITVSIAFSGCVGKGNSNISGMEMGEGLK